MNQSIVMSAISIVALLGACATNGTKEAALLSAVEKVTINSSADKVWLKVADFGNLGAWHPAVAKTEITDGVNNKVGAVRKLTLQDGGTIVETLTNYSASGMTYSYVINEGVLPFSDYASVLQVRPLSATTTEVVWRGEFKRKDLSVKPANGQDDEAATSTAHAVYRAGLDNLKKISE